MMKHLASSFQKLSRQKIAPNKSSLIGLLLLSLLIPQSGYAVNPSQNPRVKKWITVFQKNSSSYFNSWLLDSKRKLPKIKTLLKKHGLPEDLAYLPIIESGLNPKAVSSANAVGYWQFVEPTARQYGLKIEWWIDERCDLVKSTWAASRYLKVLFREFGDWYLALSAYNMGENRLKRLIKRHGDKNYWTLSLKKGFPSETRDYVPKFLAAALIAKNPKHYGFNVNSNVQPTQYTYQFVPGGTDLKTISKKLEIPSSELNKLNPELLRSLIPETVISHRIRVPKDFGMRVSLYFTKNTQ